MNHNAAKLTAEQVQHIRDLHRAGFRSSNTGNALGVCARTAADIVHGRSWGFVPDVPTALPMLGVDAAMELRLRSMKYVNDPRVQAYAETIAACHGLPVALVLLAWTRPKESAACESARLSEVSAGGMGVNL